MNEHSGLASEVKNFYSGRLFYVIGGAGFVGVQLVSRLLDAGARVVVVDNLSRGDNIVSRAPVTYRYVDIDTQMDELAAGMRVEKPKGIFNLAAAVAGVLYNMDAHVEMYSKNITLLTNPIMAAEQAGVKHFLQTSSVCIYAPEFNAPSVEENGFKGVPHSANAGYAEAKRDGERVALWSNIGHVTIVRPSNIIGPYDYYDDKAHVVPALIRRAYESETDPFILYGDPSAYREFIHSHDVATGMMHVMALGEHKEAYNLGCGGLNTITMESLAHNILERTGRRHTREIITDKRKGGGDQERWSSGLKTTMAVGWRSAISLHTALDDCIDDYKERFLD
jgi:GDP-L-fucose synthase